MSSVNTIFCPGQRIMG